MKPRYSVTFTLPAEMHRTMERVCKTEHRSTSELMRESLRRYFAALGALPMYTPTRPEVAAIERGRAAAKRGNVLTLEQFNAYVDDLNRKDRSANARPRRPSRTRATAKVRKRHG